MATVQLPALPAEFLNPTPNMPTVRNFGSMFVKLYNDANGILEKFASVREARGKTEERLQHGDTEEARKYRAAVANRDSKIEAIRNDAKYNEDRATIKALQEKIAEDIKVRSQSVRELTSQYRDAAIKAEVGAIVEELDLNALTQELTDVNKSLTDAKNMFLKECPALKGWRPVGIGAAQGGSAHRNGERGFTPRFDGAKVNGVDVEHVGKYPTSKDIAATLNISKDAWLNVLQAKALGGLPVQPIDVSEDWITFTNTFNNEEVEVSVLGRSRKAKDATDADTDTEDDEDAA